MGGGVALVVHLRVMCDLITRMGEGVAPRMSRAPWVHVG